MRSLVLLFCFSCALSAQTALGPYDAFELDADSYSPIITLPFNDDFGGSGITYTGSISTTVTADVTAIGDSLIDGEGSSVVLDGAGDSVYWTMSSSDFQSSWVMGGWFRSDVADASFERQGLFGVASQIIVDLVEDSTGFYVEASYSDGTTHVLDVYLTSSVFVQGDPFFVALQYDEDADELSLFVEYDGGAQSASDSETPVYYPLMSSSVTAYVGKTIQPSFPTPQNHYLDGQADAFFLLYGDWTNGLEDEIVDGWLGADFVRGDANSDGTLSLPDALYITNWVYNGGTEPTCIEACDVQNDGNVDVADAVYLTNYLFSSGPAPASPYPSCGYDSSVDGNSCRVSACP